MPAVDGGLNALEILAGTGGDDGIAQPELGQQAAGPLIGNDTAALTIHVPHLVFLRADPIPGLGHQFLLRFSEEQITTQGIKAPAWRRGGPETLLVLPHFLDLSGTSFRNFDAALIHNSITPHKNDISHLRIKIRKKEPADKT